MSKAQGTGNVALSGDHAKLFFWAWALSVLWHYTSSSNEIWNNWLNYDPYGTPANIIICSLAVLLAFRPGKLLPLLLLSSALLVDVWVRSPWLADHYLMTGFLALAVLIICGISAIVRNSLSVSNAEIFVQIAPLGRWLLLIMYFFGTFHKLNTAFLNPDISCAITFWEGLPLPASLIESSLAQYGAIYGTLIVEACVIIMLCIARLKFAGMLAGMLFHLVIGISTYGTLAHFSSLAFCLHLLFMPSDALQQWRESRLGFDAGRRLIYPLIMLAGILLAFYFGIKGFWTGTRMLWLFYAICLIIFVISFGRKFGDYVLREALISRSITVNVLSFLFFLNCLSPYIGLKTTSAVAMFSGLHTEGGRTNHLFFDRPPYLFSFQENPAEILHSHDYYLDYHRKNGYPIVHFQLRRYLDDHPEAYPFIYRHKGKTIVARKPGSIAELRPPESLLLLKFLNFKPIVYAPKECLHD